MAVRTKRFDPVEYLTTHEALAEYITAALETGDPAFIADSLGVVARAKGMARGRAKRASAARASTRLSRPGATRSSPLYSKSWKRLD